MDYKDPYISGEEKLRLYAHTDTLQTLSESVTMIFASNYPENISYESN